MLWSIDSCENNVSADQYYMTVSRAQVTWFFTADKFRVFDWSQAQL